MQMLISAVKDAKEGAGLVMLCSWDPLLSYGHPRFNIVSQETQLRLNVSLRNAVTDVMWLKRLLESLGYKQGCVSVYGDNKACISWANDETVTVSNSARHIHVSYHYTKEMVQAKEIEVKYVDTKHQVADVFKKALDFNNGFKSFSWQIQSWYPVFNFLLSCQLGGMLLYFS